MRMRNLVIGGVLVAGGLLVTRRQGGQPVRLLDTRVPVADEAARKDLLAAPIEKAPVPLGVKVLDAIMKRAFGAGTDQGSSSRSDPDASESMMGRAITGFPRNGVRSEDRTVPGRNGDIPIRIYTPERQARGKRPLLVEYHGGGWAVGDLNGADWICSTVAKDLDAIVVSVDYRLVPKDPFPAGVEDCYDALKWCAAHMNELGATAGRIGVMGESAGGNLSAVVCVMAKLEGGPRIHHQALIYPAVDLRTNTRSSRENANAPVLTAQALAGFQAGYVRDLDPATEWRLSPLHAPSHEGLPPALIQVAGQDPLYDQGLMYATVLRDAGVPIVLTAYPAMPHGYINMPYLCRDSVLAMRELVAEQRRYLQG